MNLPYTTAKIFIVEDIINAMYQNKLKYYKEDIIDFYESRFPDWIANIISFQIDSQGMFNADWTFGVNDILKKYGCVTNEEVYLVFKNDWNKLLPEVRELLNNE